jgi:hypothetical protein
MIGSLAAILTPLRDHDNRQSATKKHQLAKLLRDFIIPDPAVNAN